MQLVVVSPLIRALETAAGVFGLDAAQATEEHLAQQAEQAQQAERQQDAVQQQGEQRQQQAGGNGTQGGSGEEQHNNGEAESMDTDPPPLLMRAQVRWKEAGAGLAWVRWTKVFLRFALALWQCWINSTSCVGVEAVASIASHVCRTRSATCGPAALLQSPVFLHSNPSALSMPAHTRFTHQSAGQGAQRAHGARRGGASAGPQVRCGGAVPGAPG